MKLPRRQFLHLAASAAALLAVSGIARAQAYPTRPVRILNNELLTKTLRQPLTDQSREKVVGAASGKADDEIGQA